MTRVIPYIDTTVAVEKTLAEIEELLRVHNASHVVKEYESGRIKAVAFKHDGVPFQLPANVEALYQHLLTARKALPRFRYEYPSHEIQGRIHAQAERCAWRNVMAWVKAQLALVEIGMVTVTEVFLPYMLMGGNTTLYQDMMTRGLRALPSGIEEADHAS